MTKFNRKTEEGVRTKKQKQLSPKCPPENGEKDATRNKEAKREGKKSEGKKSEGIKVSDKNEEQKEKEKSEAVKSEVLKQHLVAQTRGDLDGKFIGNPHQNIATLHRADPKSFAMTKFLRELSFFESAM